jgi:glycosyltransferase involved in cell wall biosynthesis
MGRSLSVLVPVYNEQHLVYSSLERLKILETSSIVDRVQVIVVDDCSTDETPRTLERFRREQTRRRDSIISWLFLRHEKNGGKGRAIKTALEHADCEITVVHDADLEYHPKDLIRMLNVFVEDDPVDAVYGSRFAGGELRRILFYRHELGNRFLTLVTNLITNLNLTDMETCYKAVRTSLLKSIPIESDDFRIEPELTIKLAKRQARIFEVPISYSGRTYAEGKKIDWKDGVRALLAIFKHALSDQIYQLDPYGSGTLARLARASRFNAWMADTIRKYCGTRVLEIGSGVGNLTRELIPREHYVASDINPLYLEPLHALSSEHPYLRASYCNVMDASSFPQASGGYDTIICLNVIEHVDDDVKAMANIRSVLAEDGTAIVLVPNGPWNFGTLDEVLGHHRRYTKESLQKLADDSGFVVKEMIEFNRVGTPAWYLNGRILRRREFGLFQIWMLNLLTPVFRAVDPIFPFPPLSLIAILEKAEAHTVSTNVERRNEDRRVTELRPSR